MHLGSFCCILKAAIIDNEVRRMRVFLADDQTRVRSALRLLLEQEPGLSVVGEAAEAEDMLAQTEATQPDLVLLDWELPGLRTDDRLSVLRALCPQLKVIALSGQPEARRAALSAGADAFVSKGEPPERLLAAVEDCRPRKHRVDSGE
jgi:DNA-binding NarL/FixJ family response regulator